MKEKIYYVYEYIRLDTKEPFYVGKGCKDRWRDFYHRNEWFKNIINKYDVVVNILFECLDEQIAFDVECWYINEYKYELGYDLVNIVDGGEGFSSGENNPMFGKSLYDFLSDEEIKEWKRKESESNNKYWLGKTRSEETKRKISESRIGKYYGEENPFYGKTHTEETRKILSEKAMGRTSPMKGRIGELSSCYGREHSKEEKEKILLSQPTRVEVYCIELDIIFPSLSQAERYMKSTFNIVFSRRTLSDRLKKETIVSYKELLIDNVLTKLHWRYV